MKPAEAMAIAMKAHASQTRRDGFTPYVDHLFQVAKRVRMSGPDAECVAWLHDIIEDTPKTSLSLLEEGVPTNIVEAVQALTCIDMDYDQYLAGVKANELARIVKIQDMLANLADFPTRGQVLKYAKGLQFLLT